MTSQPFVRGPDAWVVHRRRSRLTPIVITLAAIAATAITLPAVGAALEEALAAQLQVDQAAKASQQRINDLKDRTQDAATRYAQATAEAESFEKYNKQLSTQVRSQEEEIASIEQQLLDIETTNREVQPLMEQMVRALSEFVALDVPFLLEERTARTRNLQNMMARADISISEKYRLILEAYQIELEYGRTLSSYQGRLGTGADARTVEFVQLGRVSLLYRTIDGSETGYWDATKKAWVPDNTYKDSVELALRVVRREGAAELLIVPVQAPQEVRS